MFLNKKVNYSIIIMPSYQQRIARLKEKQGKIIYHFPKVMGCTLPGDMMHMGPPVTQSQKAAKFVRTPGSHAQAMQAGFKNIYQMWKEQMYFFRPIPGSEIKTDPGQPPITQFEFVGLLGVKRDANKNNEFFFVPKYPDRRPNSPNNTKLVTTPFNKDGANQMIEILMQGFPEVCFPSGPFGITTICTNRNSEDLREEKQMFDDVANPKKYTDATVLLGRQMRRIKKNNQKISSGLTTPVPVQLKKQQKSVPVQVKKQQQKSVAILPTTTASVAVQVKKQQKLPVAVPVAGVVGLATTTTTTTPQQKKCKQTVVVPPPNPVVAKTNGLSTWFGMRKPLKV